jgi:acetoacetate decarboxylase
MTKAIAYRGMSSTMWAPLTPQLLKNARVLVIGYRADVDALAAALPPGLEPHENGLVQLNMYEVGAEQTSGFGAFSLTYLAIEVAGHDAYAEDGALALPGRYFAYYWSSSDRVRTYAREAVGIPAMPGIRRTETKDGKLLSILNVEGRDVITASAATTENALGTLGGQVNYYSHREFPRPEGGPPALSELLELPLPFIVDLYEATVEDILFDFPDGHPAAALAPLAPLETPSMMYGDVTFTYSMCRQIKDYLAEDGGDA